MQRTTVFRTLVLTLFLCLAAGPAYAVAAPSPARISVAVVVSDPTPLQGETVTVNVKAVYASGAPVTSVRRASVTIVDPSGTVRVSAASLTPLGSGRFTYAYPLAADAPLGTWKATATILDSRRVRASGSASFDVGRVVVPTDPPPVPGTHGALKWSEYPANCFGCHQTQFSDAYQSLHYQWQGAAPDNTNQPGVRQGKISNEINSYCINIKGNWTLCGKCHPGRGAQPVWTATPTTEQLLNVDCLVCHNDAYAKARTRLPDGSMGVTTTDTAVLAGYVRNISKPTRQTCLKCHAFAGGGDAVKRGDISSATANTTDRAYDVHMATTGGNFACQKCHAFSQHKVAGRGSDMRVTDNPAEVTCSTATCHPTKLSATGHATAAVNSHVARVACQTCHIPFFGRNAADSAASEATEIDRDWRDTSHVGGAKPWHPGNTLASNVTPVYRFWGGKSYGMLLGDANIAIEPDGTYATSKPVGAINDPTGTKLYPFKYKTATQPMRTANKTLIALDTYDYMFVSGNATTATTLGLTNMGFSAADAFAWVRTSTYQALNHSVAPKAQALTCGACHGSTARMDLKGQLGYGLKASASTVCSQCHDNESWSGYQWVHDKHVKDKKYDCSWCHNFTRAERGLRKP